MSISTELPLRSHHGQHIPEPGTYDLDQSHTTVEFVARHMMITKIRGRFTDVRGVVEIAEVPEESRAEVVLGAHSVTTFDANRDAHLRAADFFDAENHPEITFRSTAIEPGGSGTWKLMGISPSEE